MIQCFSPASPSAPKDLKVAEVTRRHVHLMWEAPDHDGGSPVTHYQIEKREVSRKTWVKVHFPSLFPVWPGLQKHNHLSVHVKTTVTETQLFICSEYLNIKMYIFPLGLELH